MNSTLTVNGTAYSQAGRRAANYLIDGWGWDVDSGFWLEFHEHSAGPQPTLAGPVPVSLSVGGTPLFAGDLVSAVPAIDGQGRRTWGYRALGLEYRANWIPVTATDGSGVIRFNTSPTNTDYYVPSLAGQSVGQIFSYCLTQHATALTAAGITTDATTSASLAALTLVPADEIQIAGERLWTALTTFLQRYQRNIRPIITAAGKVRLVDITTGAAHTLTMGTDPIEPVLFSRNWTSSATQVRVRGGGIIEPGYVSVLKGTLTPAWTSTQQSSWTYADFTSPTGPSTDHGSVTAIVSATQITISSSDAARAWAANYWSGLQAWVYVTKTSGLGVTYTESRPVTACTALSAGGSCTLTLAYGLQNSASGSYDSYQLIGTNVPLSGGGLYDVWRLYDVTDPGGLISGHLVPTFPVPVPFLGYDGTSATLTSAPMAFILGASGGASAPFVVLPQTGQILFARPTVEVNNSVSDLNAGTYSAPVDIYVLLAYSRGALTTQYPASGYTGTAFTAAGLERTQTVDMYDWRYAGNVSPLTDLSQMLCTSVCNTLTEGTITYRGYYAALQDPTGGHLMSVAANGYTTGDESLNIPVRRFSVQYLNEGGGLNYTCQFFCSTRQEPRTAESQYVHLSVLGSGGMVGANLPPTGFGAKDKRSIAASARYAAESLRMTQEATRGRSGFTGQVLDAGSSLAAMGAQAARGVGGFGSQAARLAGGFGSAASRLAGGFGSAADRMAGLFSRAADGIGAGMGGSGDWPGPGPGDDAAPRRRSRRGRDRRGDPRILGNIPGNRPGAPPLRHVLPPGGINAGLPPVDNMLPDDLPRDPNVFTDLEPAPKAAEAPRPKLPEPKVVPLKPKKPAKEPAAPALPPVGGRPAAAPAPRLDPDRVREGVGGMAADLAGAGQDAGAGLGAFVPTEIPD